MKLVQQGIFTLMLFSLIPGLYAQDEDGGLDYLAQRDLVVSLSTRIMQTQEKTIWKMDNTKVTPSGQAVSVKMTGENVVIFAQITPYLQNDNSILLIAQGEVFISSEEEGTKYYSTLKSLPIVAGEKVLFFPLGMAVDSEKNLYYIELEIQVLPRED